VLTIGHGAEPEFRVASTKQRAMEHVGDTNLHINLNDALVFDTDPTDLGDGILVAVTNQVDIMAYEAQWLNLIMVQWNANWLTIPNEGSTVKCGVATVGYVSSLDFSEATECFYGSLPTTIGSDSNMRL
jgi:hypothetical protein